MKIKWTKIFNWDINNVYPPYKESFGETELFDGAYMVKVEYLHHGTWIVPFYFYNTPLDEEKAAQQKAEEYYNERIQKKQIQEKRRRENTK